MRGVANWGEVCMLVMAVMTQALPPVVVPADLMDLGLRELFGASRSDPGLLGWASIGKTGAVRVGVVGGEAVLTPGSGASLACPHEVRWNLAAFFQKATS